MAKLPPRAAREAEGGRRLAVIGGRLEDDNAPVYKEMARLSNGRMLVFPTASSEPEAVGEESAAAFANFGFEVEVAPLHGPDAAARARDPAIIEQIRRLGSVYFTGGDQAQILDALMPGGRRTPVLEALFALHAGGGLIAGSSAGAAMMSDPMIMGGTSLESVVHGVTEDPDRPGLLIGRGIGLFPFGLVDQHFIKRGRLGRLVVALHAAGRTRGYGIDENTALFVEGASGAVVGEYGVMAVDISEAEIDVAKGCWRNCSVSYLDHGDSIDLRDGRAFSGEEKRRVLKQDVAYRAPLRSRRNAFGAYTLYDLMARLVLGHRTAYRTDHVEAFDARTGRNAVVRMVRPALPSRSRIAKPAAGLRMTALEFRCDIEVEQLSATRLADREGRPARTFGMEPKPDAKIVLFGSSPLASASEMLSGPLALAGSGPVGVLASASAEPRQAAAEHIEVLARHGITGIDLDVSIDTVEYAEHDEDLLERIEALPAILLCGGNQSRLVETLLHRGEESAVLRAIARAHARGATLYAASGAASALSGVMIAGGSTYEALRFGVSSDVGHQGLAIQEGIGLFSTAIVDQNLLRSDRLGRLVVACAEENERFGIGVFEDGAAIASHAGRVLHAAGRSGFVLVEIDPLKLELHSDNFKANGIRLTVLGPGDSVDLRSAEITRGGPVDASATLLTNLIAGLVEEAGAAVA
ncbi:MAG: cyanophycinase, partial [Pseudomonadales bacterium]|nr:cyanophycinase [Pseudomonadales bacterium]